MSLNALQKEQEAAQRHALEVRLHIVAGQQKDVSKLKKAKKRIAQLKTAERQRQLGISE